MDYRILGGSGLKVSSLCLGTGTFGGGTEFFRALGLQWNVEEAKRLVSLVLMRALLSSIQRISTLRAFRRRFSARLYRESAMNY